MTKQEKSWILYDWANSAYAVAVMGAILPIFFKDYAAKGVPDYLSTAYWGYSNTLATLAVFTFMVGGRSSAGRLWSGIVGGFAWVGRWFLVTALALGFAGAFTAAVSILIGRLGHLFALAERVAGLLGLAGG